MNGAIDFMGGLVGGWNGFTSFTINENEKKWSNE